MDILIHFTLLANKSSLISCSFSKKSQLVAYLTYKQIGSQTLKQARHEIARHITSFTDTVKPYRIMISQPNFFILILKA